MLNGLIDTTLSCTRLSHQTVHQRGLVLHVVSIGEPHLAQMGCQGWEHGVSNSCLVDGGSLRGQQSDQLRQPLRHLGRSTQQCLGLIALPAKSPCCVLIGAHPPAFHKQLLLVLQQPLVGLSVVLVEIVDQRLDVHVLPVLGHQLLQHAVHLVLRQQLCSAAQQHLHAGVAATLV